ncbi:MAG TPA: hypothetical protein VH854_02545 [Thermoanaerobaculia bacterium]|nr:hypothetical protein [Thermoanaerobaculia bacterium]
MNSNVLPFDLTRRGGMARRGAPDKLGVFQSRIICPTCAGELRLDADRVDGSSEVLCAQCETEIPLGVKTG